MCVYTNNRQKYNKNCKVNGREQKTVNKNGKHYARTQVTSDTYVYKIDFFSNFLQRQGLLS